MCLMLFFDTARMVCMQQGGLCNGMHLSLSVCLSHLPAAAVCSQFTAVGPCGQEILIDRSGHWMLLQQGVQQQMQAVSYPQPGDVADHRLVLDIFIVLYS